MDLNGMVRWRAFIRRSGGVLQRVTGFQLFQTVKSAG